MPRILLTGATGFVGRSVRPALLRAGWQVRGLSRDARRARARWPELEWIEGDVGDPAVCARALTGCDTALYLVHAIGEGADFRRREVATARTFAAAAGAVPSMRRIVYLGGVAPIDAGSEHLQSRLEVGEALRAGLVATVELRASMIVGHGSLSWLVVRDLAARLPVMVLPRWLRSRTEPVAIDDVVVALVRALELETDSAWFDIPGPDVLTGKQILAETARVMGLRRPASLDVPLLTPRLSSLWVRFVTRADWSVARNIVVGLTHDLLAQSDRYWSLIDHPVRLSFAEAARRALAAEEREGVPVRGPWGVVERVLAAHGS
ncbi:NAD(P)H-binding protein [Nannocystis punicea]|uniref:NAD(P)H-binding protein n=1 Tax=Nannocystis punicea TaxID=2995304 RepID=A0ABY7H657_9BACT|nr:NAD(P)H-binding protein [Nannocystis poenicansa]WAS94504.1 NAD(P)H-binding protein [Nannocystis poenicansa]